MQVEMLGNVVREGVSPRINKVRIKHIFYYLKWILRNFAKKGVHRECTGRVEARKYLKKSCCHRIECPVANFLAAFIWRRPLNNAALATTTHRKPESVSDGTSTQVVAQMINKCRIKIVQKELYNVGDPPWMRDWKERERKDCSNQNCICNLFNWFIL